MKKMTFSLLAAITLLTVSIAETKAQVSVGVHVGLWSPPPEYASVNYYYLPDVESYYYVPTHQYVYLSGGRWVFRAALPPRYADYDIASGYKVAVERPRAYRYFYHDRDAYRHYRGVRNAGIVRDHYRTRYVDRPREANRARYENRDRYANRPGRFVRSPRENVYHNRQPHDFGGRPQPGFGGRPHGGEGRPHGDGGRPHPGGGGGGGRPHPGGGGGGRPHGGPDHH